MPALDSLSTPFRGGISSSRSRRAVSGGDALLLAHHAAGHELVRALEGQPDFLRQVMDVVERPEVAEGLAAPYVYRDDSGLRRALVEALLLVAANGYRETRRWEGASAALLASATSAGFPSAAPAHGERSYRRRPGAASTLRLGADVVARRGSSCCVRCGSRHPRPDERGRRREVADYCRVCNLLPGRDRRADSDKHAERTFWRELFGALPAYLVDRLFDDERLSEDEADRRELALERETSRASALRRRRNAA